MQILMWLLDFQTTMFIAEVAIVAYLLHEALLYVLYKDTNIKQEMIGE